MLQIYSTQSMERIEAALRDAAEHRCGHLLAVSHFSQFGAGTPVAFTVCFTDLYTPLLAADVRYAALLPCRIAACPKSDGVLLETISAGQYTRLIDRPDLARLAAALDDTLRGVMEAAAHGRGREVGHPATEDQINMRAALPQRIDCHGTKVEELAGTGVLDTQGG